MYQPHSAGSHFSASKIMYTLINEFDYIQASSLHRNLVKWSNMLWIFVNGKIQKSCEIAGLTIFTDKNSNKTVWKCFLTYQSRWILSFISCFYWPILIHSMPFLLCVHATLQTGFHVTFERNITSASFGEGYINLNPLSATCTPPRRHPGGFCYFYLIISWAYSGVRIHLGWQELVLFESSIALFSQCFAMTPDW